MKSSDAFCALVLTLPQSAKQAFSSIESRKIPTITSLNKEYYELRAMKNEHYKRLGAYKKEMREALTSQKNIDTILTNSKVKRDSGVLSLI
ncbi:MAG TPA: hypothetical protein P5280_01555 [Cyclobacteriaceae bacterium]|nr:hypothetical protein [Cyclobacteriaceae bacterium]